MTDSNVHNDGTNALITSASLLERAKMSDQSAWGRIVDLYGPLVYRWCRRHGLQDVDTQDIGQLVFKSVYQNLSRFRRDRTEDSFRKWLKTITVHKIYDHLRSLKRRDEVIDSTVAELASELTDPGANFDEDEKTEQKELLIKALQQIRNEFKTQTWTTFQVHVIDGLSVAETAERCGVTTNSVYLAKSRIVHRLRDLYGEIIDDLYRD